MNHQYTVMNRIPLLTLSGLLVAACHTDKPAVKEPLIQFLSPKICACFVEQEKQGPVNMDTYDACFSNVFAENEQEAIPLSGKTADEMADGTYWREAGKQVGFHVIKTCPSIARVVLGH